MRYRGWRIAVFVGLTLPLLYWLYRGLMAQLGPNPGKVLVINLGQAALISLLLSLSMTPLQKLSGWGGWIGLRRQLGLWGFTYATLHWLSYLGFILGFNFAQMGVELAKRPYVVVGASAWLCLLPLALTSNRFSMRRLGKRWKQLHRLVYLAVSLVLLHFLWVVRSDWGQWLLYAVCGASLLALRLPAISRHLGAFKGRFAAKVPDRQNKG
jgi:sulfoxide reductase heme-binding subunit YedZ